MAAKGDVALLISQSGADRRARAGDRPFRRASASRSSPSPAIPARCSARRRRRRWSCRTGPKSGPEAVAPTTSTTMTLALGDALAMTVMREKGFTRTDFGRLHPGRLARRAAASRSARLMHGGDAAAADRRRRLDARRDRRNDRKAARLVGVTDGDGRLVGVITDGDLRRNIERGLDHPARDFMTADPKTIAPDALVDEALTLFDEHRITALFVVEGGRPVGVLHIHDCPAARDEDRHPDPGALRLVALSGQAAGRAARAHGGAAKPLIQRSCRGGAQGAGDRRGPCRHRRRAHRRLRCAASAAACS